jgi:hypothetical protein
VNLYSVGAGLLVQNRPLGLRVDKNLDYVGANVYKATALVSLNVVFTCYECVIVLYMSVIPQIFVLIRETSGIRIKGNHSSIHSESKESAHVRSFVITIFENR